MNKKDIIKIIIIYIMIYIIYIVTLIYSTIHFFDLMKCICHAMCLTLFFPHYLFKFCNWLCEGDNNVKN